MSSRYSVDDYARAAAALLPRGAVWQAAPGSTQAAVLLGLAGALARSDAAAMDLLADARPDTTFNLLTEWEESVGLPDPCAGANPTVEQRRAQVVARFAGVGGQSRAFFVNYAKALGIEITIETHAPFRAGRNRVGDPVNGPDWAFCWTVNVVSDESASEYAMFRAGQGHAGDPLGNYTAFAILQCEFDRLKAAETNVLIPR